MPIANWYQTIDTTNSTDWSSSLKNFGRLTIVQPFYYMLVLPLYYLYRGGPNFHGFGFWNGWSDAQICNVLTGHKAEQLIWMESREVCEKIIHDDFQSWIVLLGFIFYLWIFINVLKCLFCLSCKSTKKQRVYYRAIKKRKVAAVDSELEE